MKKVIKAICCILAAVILGRRRICGRSESKTKQYRIGTA